MKDIDSNKNEYLDQFVHGRARASAVGARYNAKSRYADLKWE